METFVVTKLVPFKMAVGCAGGTSPAMVVTFVCRVSSWQVRVDRNQLYTQDDAKIPATRQNLMEPEFLGIDSRLPSQAQVSAAEFIIFNPAPNVSAE